MSNWTSRVAGHALRRAFVAAALSAVAPISSGAFAAAADYRFELVGKPAAAPGGGSLITVRLVHVPDGAPVAGAVVFRLKADMGPAGMAGMAAPAKLVGEASPGVYQLTVKQNMAGAWAIALAAKVQGEAETVHGTVVATLGP